MARVESIARKSTGLIPLTVTLTLLWGTSWSLFPVAIREVSVWTFRSVCLLGSGVLLLAFAKLRGLSLHVPKHQRVGLAVAALVYLVVWNVGSVYASILIPSGQAAVLGFTMPLWAGVLSWAVLGERPSSRLMVSIAFAAAGIALLGYAARDTYSAAPLGFVLGLSAGIGWACGTLVLKRAGITVSPVVSTGWQMVIGGLPIFVVALVTGDHHAFMPSLTSIVVIAYITIVPMAMGNVAWFAMAHRLPPTISGLCTVMVPIVAMVAGAAFRHEPLGANELGAMACCFASLLVIVMQPRSRAAALEIDG